MEEQEIDRSNIDYEKNQFLINLYFDEWKFRQEGMWKRITQFFVILFFVSTLPITIGAFDGVMLPNISKLAFPISGIILTIFFLWFCLSESIRINSIDAQIKNIIKDTYGDKYLKNKLVPLTKHFQDKGHTLKIFTWRMAIWVPVVLSTVQILIAIFVLYCIHIGLL